MPDWTSLPPESRRSPSLQRDTSEAFEVHWEARLGVALISHPFGLVLGTPEDVARWGEKLFAKLGAIEKERHGRFPIVVSVDGLTIRPLVAEEYAKVARRYADRFASGLARYSRRPDGVGQIITMPAIRRYRANLFTSRSEAVAYALGRGAEPTSQRRP
jgi:hypothetical protein